MEETIRDSIRIAEVRKIKNPTVVMNDKDLETFIKKIEAKVNNFKFGDNPTYEGIPIVGRKEIEQGKFFIYDGIVDKLFNYLQRFGYA